MSIFDSMRPRPVNRAALQQAVAPAQQEQPSQTDQQTALRKALQQQAVVIKQFSEKYQKKVTDGNPDEQY